MSNSQHIDSLPTSSIDGQERSDVGVSPSTLLVDPLSPGSNASTSPSSSIGGSPLQRSREAPSLVKEDISRPRLGLQTGALGAHSQEHDYNPDDDEEDDDDDWFAPKGRKENGTAGAVRNTGPQIRK